MVLLVEHTEKVGWKAGGIHAAQVLTQQVRNSQALLTGKDMHRPSAQHSTCPLPPASPHAPLPTLKVTPSHILTPSQNTPGHPRTPKYTPTPTHLRSAACRGCSRPLARSGAPTTQTLCQACCRQCCSHHCLSRGYGGHLPRSHCPPQCCGCRGCLHLHVRPCCYAGCWHGWSSCLRRCLQLGARAHGHASAAAPRLNGAHAHTALPVHATA